MVGTLIESRGLRQRRTGGSVTSIIFHSALIAAAIAATATESNSTPRPPRDLTVIFRPVPPPTPAQPRPTRRVIADNPGPAAPALPRIDAPSIIPTEIPPIDLNAPSTADYVNELRRGAICGDRCGIVGLGTDGTGESPVWELNDIAMRLRENPVPPRYPEALRRAGIDGGVLVKFVVDTTGRVDMGSIEVVRTSHELFSAAVRESLGKLRFHPATAGNRKITATAMMPFQFTLK